MRRSFKFFLLFIVLGLSLTVGVQAQTVNNPVNDPAISTEALKYRLTPLTQDELMQSADYWQQLLETHLGKTAELEITRARNKEQGPVKDELLASLKQANEQSRILEDKFGLVVQELQNKGGDAKKYQQYLDAVSGTKVDMENSSAMLTNLKDWLESPEGGLRWAKNIVFFVIALIAFQILASVLGKITLHAAQRMKNTSGLLQHFFAGTVTNLTKLIGLMVALSMLEINIGPFVAALGATGFIVGFALQGTLSNFAAGLMILIYRPYDVGDVVNVAGVTGKVDSMTLVSTSLKLPDNQLVVIPNNSIWGTTLTNVTGSDTRRVDMVFGIGYQDDIAKAEAVLTDILANHPLVLKDPEPVIKLHELGDSSVNFVVRPWTQTAEYFNVYWDITRAVKERFDAEGISIPYPQTDVHLHTVTENG